MSVDTFITEAGELPPSVVTQQLIEVEAAAASGTFQSSDAGMRRCDAKEQFSASIPIKAPVTR